MSSNKTTLIQPRTQLDGKSFAFFGELAQWPYRACEPTDLVLELGGQVAYEVSQELDYMVIGSASVRGAAAKKLEQGEKTLNKLKLAAGKGSTKCPEMIDEETFMRIVAVEVTGKRFAFFGGFDLCDGDTDPSLLHHMVKDVGAVVVSDVDENLDYAVLGNIRRPGRAQAETSVKKLMTAGHRVRTINEDRFLELVRNATPIQRDITEKMEFGSFVSHLHAKIDTGKLGRALKMLRTESFQLYVNKDDESLLGVVKSQSGSGKVYFSWLNAHGHFGCATRENKTNFEDCLGMSGDICKHLLVLLLGLVRCNKMDANMAYKWITSTNNKLPSRDQDLLAEAYIQYNGVQMGEIDWRPTETMPEDYYAF